MKSPATQRSKLVLVGGGHAHVLVLQAFAEHPEAGVDLTLIAPDAMTPYSGMLPGHVAGLYGRDEMHIDLARLSRRSGARLIQDEAVGFDRAAKMVRLKQGPPVAYDVLSIDIGITPDLTGIAGAAEHAIAVKPIGRFLTKWEGLRAAAVGQDGPYRIVVVGGGAAGVCLAFAVTARLRREAREGGLDPSRHHVTLVEAGELLPDLNGGVRRAVAKAFSRRGIEVLTGTPIRAIEPGWITCADGSRIRAEAALVSTQAAPPPAVAASDLARDHEGFLAVGPTLQVEGEDSVFAVGDCATMVLHPRPKAGVFAVRQGRPLAENLRRRLRGEGLRPYRPQRNTLVLLATGDGEAIGGRGAWLAIEGRWVWRLKDWIDRRFMRRFR